jgi:transglutaminase/protease-like cytokinesis protein 3
LRLLAFFYDSLEADFHNFYQESFRNLYCQAPFVKTCLLYLGLFSFILSDAQDFGQVDRYAEKIHGEMPDLLARKLSAPFKTDIEKFRAIFSWITYNIEYNANPRTNASRYAKQKTDTTWDSRSLDERVAYNVIKNKTAVCDGYARLLKTLCDYSGLSCNVICGFAKTGESRDKYFCTNHTWNAVYINNSWKLVDITWASGYVSQGNNSFIRMNDDKYFLASPEEFIKNHYPEDPQWTLLEKPPVLREFQDRPFLLKAFIKNRIVDYSPSTGTLNAAEGDTIQLKLTMAENLKTAISESEYYSSLPHFASSSFEFLEPVSTSEKEILYRYIVKQGIQWLNVLYRDDIVMRYRVKVRQ